ncbi:ClpB protein [Yersinia thracica]|uniref:ClpB protein n=1 Tax=Yersinia thracica TaxID=2890319 RepID=A0A0T9NGC3_9GAMM|nr:type VI secretion system ATPase TssH [Yersinia thracica]CNH06219.1 ClpB protein [Yersinia thracica]
MSEISRSTLFRKLNNHLFSCIENATAFCKLRGNPYVELVHWLHQLIQSPEGDLQQLIRYFSIDRDRLAQDIVDALDRLPRGASSISDLSEHIDNAVERAWLYSSLQFGSQKIRGGYLLIGMLKTHSLRCQLTEISALFNQINTEQLVEQFTTITACSSENVLTPSVAETIESTADGSSVLTQYGIDLTAHARQGKIDPVVGRDEEIRQVIDILMRRRQNNPLLTGEAGVGKTAVVEGLALRIIAGDVPPQLRGVQLYLLDINMLQAGAGVKGEFEKRLQSVIDEVQSSQTPIILFIDEIHTLMGAGGTQGTGDAANLLKPALARGQLRTVGATTWAEYKKYIEKDPALTRRFQVVQVHEPNEDKARLMLRSIVCSLEQHHRVLLLDEAVDAAVRLSHRYIPARQLPDKAIALLDTACARVAISQHTEPAPVENCRRNIEALQIELDIARREINVSIGNPLHPSEIETQLLAQQQQLELLILRWRKEQQVAKQVIELRAKLHQQEIDKVEEKTEDQDTASLTVDELRSQLSHYHKQLDKLQDESPLIFTAVDANVVAAVVADWTGIPLGRMVKNEIEAVLQLSDTLNQRIFGQRHALDLIARRVHTSRARLDDPNKPVGVFLLVGPSGVGKTETAFALAETLYGGKHNVITINMSEFQEPHTVSTLKGAPPGYVGYGEGGVLTEAVRRRPYSVVLLDEIEKAHPDVHEIFFQVFDKGWMEDGEGRYIDFRNTIIILTSNVGSDLIAELCDKPDQMPEPKALHQMLRQELLSVFPAAFLGRLLITPYYPLTDTILENIVRLQLSNIQHRLLENHGITSTFSNEVIDQIVTRCTEVESGGRMVDSILTNTLMPEISHTLLAAKANKPHYRQLHISLENNEFVYEYDIHDETH